MFYFPLTTPTVLLGFLLPWTRDISSWLLQQSTATAPYLGRGVSPHCRPSWPWTWKSTPCQLCTHPHLSTPYLIPNKDKTRKRWQEYKDELYKKILHDPDNHDGVITHLEPDILECEVKWALESITMIKARGGDGIPVELFQILKDDAVKVLHSIC